MILAATPLTISPGYVFSMRDAATNGPYFIKKEIMFEMNKMYDKYDKSYDHHH